MKNCGLFSKPQVLNLRHALISIQLVGTEGFDHAVVMPDDVVDVLLRCDAVFFRIGGSPVACWSLENLPLVLGSQL